MAVRYIPREGLQGPMVYRLQILINSARLLSKTLEVTSSPTNSLWSTGFPKHSPALDVSTHEFFRCHHSMLVILPLPGEVNGYNIDHIFRVYLFCPEFT